MLARRLLPLVFLLTSCTGLSESDRGSCEEDTDCTAVFGGGSVCVAESGLCTQPDTCSEDATCIADFGPGWTCDEAASTCFGPDSGDTIAVAETIDVDQTWTGENTYLLQDVIYVSPGVTLTIEAGTQILGEQGSALVVRPGGTIQASGTPSSPIVFTSSQPVGSRAPGDWAGVALLGRATTNADTPLLEGLVEEDLAAFGGTDDEYSCGILEYVRIEFAGFALKQDEELNGLTLGGCGRGTIINHVQVHFGKDDGVEVFGGTVDLRNLVITRAQDDSLDWDLGWRGTAQFLAIQQDAEGDNGFEASSAPDLPADPQAAPKIYNATLLGSFNAGSTRGINFKDGTGGTVRNLLLVGHGIESIDIQGAEAVAALQDGSLSVANAMAFQAGDGMHFFPTVEDETDSMPDEGLDDDEGFDEDAFFRGIESFVLGVDPALSAPMNLTGPGWVPSSTQVVDAAAMPPAPFDEGARFVGAFAPGQTAWTAGWTAYPAN